MNIKTFIFLAFIVLVSCQANSPINSGANQKATQGDTTISDVAALEKKEGESRDRQLDNIGVLIAGIPFSVKADNKEDFENGIKPWASIEKPDQDLAKLIDRDKIVLRDTIATLIIDYPLTNEYRIDLHSKNGFTKGQLLTAISANYFKLYDDEEKSATIKTIPVARRTTMENRNQTDGKYGIWGHDIADLILTEVLVYRAVNGKITLMLGIES